MRNNNKWQKIGRYIIRWDTVNGSNWVTIAELKDRVFCIISRRAYYSKADARHRYYYLIAEYTRKAKEAQI